MLWGSLLWLSADWNIGLAPQKEKEDFDERPNGPLTCDPGPCGARQVNAEDREAGRQQVPVVDPELFGPFAFWLKGIGAKGFDNN